MSEPNNDEVAGKLKKIAFCAINNISDEILKLNLDPKSTYKATLFCLSLSAASLIDSFNKRCDVYIDDIIELHVSTIHNLINQTNVD
jgi:hypothetical protein